MDIQQAIDEIAYEVSINSTQVTLFIGSGFSTWLGLPDWRRLFSLVVTEMKIQHPEYGQDVEKIKMLVESYELTIPEAFNALLSLTKTPTVQLKKEIAGILSYYDRYGDSNIVDTSVDIAKYSVVSKLVPYCNVVTTNFDLMIERMAKNLYGQNVKVFYPDSNNLQTGFFQKTESKLSILKLHGDITNYDQMIVTKQDYDTFQTSDSYKKIRESFKRVLTDTITIFIGYSLNDINVIDLLDEVDSTYKKDRKKSYIFTKYENGFQYILSLDKNRIPRDKLPKAFIPLEFDKKGVEEISIVHFDEINLMLYELQKIIHLPKVIDEISGKSYADRGRFVSNDFATFKDFIRAEYFLENGYLSLASKFLDLHSNLYCEEGNNLGNIQYLALRKVLTIKYSGKGQDIEEDFQSLDQLVQGSPDKDKDRKHIVRYLEKCAKVRKYSSTISLLGSYVEYDQRMLKLARKLLCESTVDDEEYHLLVLKIIPFIKESQTPLFKDERIILNASNMNPLYLLQVADINTKLIKILKRNEESDNLADVISLTNKIYSTVDEQLMDCCEWQESSLICRAWISLYLQKYDLVERYCRHVLTQNPFHEEAQLLLVEAYSGKGAVDKAIMQCDYLLNHSKDFCSYHDQTIFLKAHCIAQKADFVHEMMLAIHLLLSINNFNDYVDVTDSLAIFYMSAKNYIEYKKYIVRTAFLDPNNAEVFKEAVDALGATYPGEVDDFDFQSVFSEIQRLEDQKRVQKKMKYLYGAPKIQRQPDAKLVLLIAPSSISLQAFLSNLIINDLPEKPERDVIIRGLQQFNTSHYEDAYNTLKQFTAIYHYNKLLNFIIFKCLVMLNREDDAMTLFYDKIDDSLSFYEEEYKAMIHYLIARVHEAKEQYEEALIHFKQAISYDHKFWESFFGLGSTQFKLFQCTKKKEYALESRDNYLAAIIKSPRIIPQLYTGIINSLIALGQFDQAYRYATNLKLFYLDDKLLQETEEIIHYLDRMKNQ